MIWPIYALYVLTVDFIRVYKWIELQILKVFSPLLRRKGIKLAATLGVVLHSEQDTDSNNSGKGTVEQSEIALLKCEKYDKLVHFKYTNNSLFTRVANTGLLGFGECFMDGTFDYCNSPDDLTEMGTRMLENDMFDLYYNWWNKTLEKLELHTFNLQTRKRAFQVGEVHYDLGKYQKKKTLYDIQMS